MVSAGDVAGTIMDKFHATARVIEGQTSIFCKIAWFLGSERLPGVILNYAEMTIVRPE